MTSVLFVRLPELKRMLGGISTMTVVRWEKRGWLPPRVRLGPNVVAWPVHEIEAFANRLLAGRQNGVGNTSQERDGDDTEGKQP